METIIEIDQFSFILTSTYVKEILNEKKAMACTLIRRQV